MPSTARAAGTGRRYHGTWRLPPESASSTTARFLVTGRSAAPEPIDPGAAGPETGASWRRCRRSISSSRLTAHPPGRGAVSQLRNQPRVDEGAGRRSRVCTALDTISRDT
jgi:hypothetical protein